MRKHRNRRNQQRKIIIISTVCLVTLMTIGWAAFNTRLNINVKGNVLTQAAASQLKEKVTTNGDGLYEDTFEEGRYVYKGTNPDNYISFNNELWRIISVENDKTLKIVKNGDIGLIPFDPAGNRDITNNTYCNTSNGCNAWSKMDGTYTNGSSSGTVTADSKLNIYLNNTYYNELNDEYKSYIQIHDFSIGSINGNNTVVSSALANEKRDVWQGKIGLINVSDFIKASSNNSCYTSTTEWCPADDNYNQENYKCAHNNYLYIKKHYWTLQANNRSSQFIIIVTHYDGCLGNASAFHNKIYVLPSLFLKANIKLEGNGTKDIPYTIIPI